MKEHEFFVAKDTIYSGQFKQKFFNRVVKCVFHPTPTSYVEALTLNVTVPRERVFEGH